MKNYELEQLISWRFVPIDRGKKGPNKKDWQLHPYKLEDIPQDGNIGVILGPTSNGLLAIDFDGPWAWEYWLEHIQISFNSFDTVMWSSNKPGRCQMAFTVPKEFWQYMEMIKVKGPLGDDNKHQGFEFRWGDVQSVLPPSLHPDTNREYEWVRKPSEISVCEAPVELLEWAYNYKIEKETFVPETVVYEPKSVDGEEANKIAEKLKYYYPTLDYDTWIRVTWGFCNSVGHSDGLAIMKYYYPEQKQGEYNKLLKSRPNGKVCTIGTIIKLIKDKGGTIKEPSTFELINSFLRN